MIYVGTSGYSYEDWVGPFYPEGLAKGAFLEHYAHQFCCVEVNFTYYRMPTASTLAAMSRKVAPDFRFSVRATGELTHERSGRDDAFREFAAALQPMIDDGKFACVLAQFPYAFKPSDENRGYLAHFRKQLVDLAVVVEFRNAGWVSKETVEFLRQLGLGFCCVDEPSLKGLVPPVAGTTSNVGYLRFHGRNAAKWFDHQEAWERYDYLYSREELAEWVPKAAKIAANSEDTYVFFNNHYNAQAVQNASLFVDLLQEADLAVST